MIFAMDYPSKYTGIVKEKVLPSPLIPELKNQI
jgi:hypothetical protein